MAGDLRVCPECLLELLDLRNLPLLPLVNSHHRIHHIASDKLPAGLDRKLYLLDHPPQVLRLLRILLFVLEGLDLVVLFGDDLVGELLVGGREDLAVDLFGDFVQHQDEVDTLVEVLLVLGQNRLAFVALQPVLQDVVVGFLAVAACPDFCVFLELWLDGTASFIFLLFGLTFKLLPMLFVRMRDLRVGRRKVREV